MIAPSGAGVTSTVGVLTAPLAFDFVRSSYGRLEELDWDEVNDIFGAMEAEGRAVLTASGVQAGDIRYGRIADMRYVGQGHEVRVPIPNGPLSAQHQSDIVREFETVYQR